MHEDQDERRWSRWRIVAGTTLLGFMVAALASMLATPQYTSGATVLLQGNGRDGVDDLLQSSASVVTSPRVMSAVVDELGLPLTPSQLADKIAVTNPANTTVLDITAADPNPEVAQSIANAAAQQLQTTVQGIGATNADDEPLANVRVLLPAELPTTPSSPSTLANVAIGLLIGLAAGVVAVVARERLGRRPNGRSTSGTGGGLAPSP